MKYSRSFSKTLCYCLYNLSCKPYFRYKVNDPFVLFKHFFS